MTLSWALVILAFLVTSPIWGPFVIVIGVSIIAFAVGGGIIAWIAFIDFINWVGSLRIGCRRKR